MTHDSSPTTTGSSSRLGDRIRSIAQQIRQEDEVQIQATARILGAAAQIAQNHDRLIDEVVNIVEEDLDQAETAAPTQLYTVEQLKNAFKTLKEAKNHFSLKARSWDALVETLNQSQAPGPEDSAKTLPKNSGDFSQSHRDSSLVDQRLQSIEQELQTIQHDLKHLTQLMMQMLEQMG